MQTDLKPRNLPRWFKSWIILTLWLSLMPILIAVVYGYLRGSSDFDPILRSLRSRDMVWAVKIGRASCYRPDAAVYSSNFGINAVNSEFDQSRAAVWNGTLSSAYQATYLGWFRGARLPTVFSVLRRVSEHGDVSHAVYWNGRKPLAHYITYCILLGAAGILFFEIASRAKKQRTSTLLVR